MPILPEHQELWSRLAAFEFVDPDAQLDLPTRLARENGWTVRYAIDVLAEYRRFLFLAVTGDEPVTPSDDVDQAWHLHLTYSESYWNELCRDVLGVELHHGPTRGGPDESATYRDWYARTLKQYAAVFDARPPRTIWPSVRRRFRDADRFVRINTRRMILLPRWVGVVMAVVTVMLMAGGLAILGTATSGVPPLPLTPVQQVQVAVGGLFGLGALNLFTLGGKRFGRRRRTGSWSGGSSGFGCGGGGCGGSCGGGGGCGGCGGCGGG